jgi:hypothetical protein
MIEGSTRHLPPGDDPGLELIYREALCGLVQQQTLVESMNGRAGNLIFAAAFAS